ncbi:MAG: tetratricopeptide repeat protein, partial [Verrucomicrobiota bacterium]
YEGDLFPSDPEQAEIWLKRAVGREDPLGFYFYGNLVELKRRRDGNQESESLPESYWNVVHRGLTETKADGHVLEALSHLHLEGLGDLTPDPEKAFQLSLQASEYELPRPWLRLGSFYEEGIGVERSDEKAFQCYLRSAQLGSSIGSYHLGRCYINGIGVQPDRVLGLAWLARSAEKGHPHSYLALEQLLDLGAATISSAPNLISSRDQQFAETRPKDALVKVPVDESAFWLGKVIEERAARYRLEIVSVHPAAEPLGPSSSTGQLPLSDADLGESRWVWVEAVVDLEK